MYISKITTATIFDIVECLVHVYISYALQLLWSWCIWDLLTVNACNHEGQQQSCNQENPHSYV